jgi:hypothetical protein
MAVAHTLGYYDTAIFSFIVQTPSKNAIDSDKYCTYLATLGGETLIESILYSKVAKVNTLLLVFPQKTLLMYKDL